MSNQTANHDKTASKREGDSGSTFITLLSSDLRVGHCVIVNHCEQPCGKLLSVIVAVEGDTIFTKYLNADPQLTPFNKRGVENRRDNVTPCGHFGVEVRVQNHVYWCQPVSESTATYADGKIRPWQERAYVGKFKARRSVLRVAKSG